MGHKDTRMLDRIYAKLPPELLRVRLLALGRCSTGAVKHERNWCTNGCTGQQVDDVSSGKLAPQSPQWLCALCLRAEKGLGAVVLHGRLDALPVSGRTVWMKCNA